jgi:AAA15 family ATPase/GTPase
MLVMASELANASGGILLADEIESGLHVSVMEAMWRMLIQTALAADVQIFATTHSDDCLRGLASLFDDSAPAADRALAADVSVYRIDRGVPVATRYSPESMHRALDSGMEIRG